MKKLLFTAFAVIALALTSIAGPHTKEYQDVKNVLNQYEQNVNNATTCEDLETASIEFYLTLMSLIDVEYDEDQTVTEEEERELNEHMESITNRLTSLQEQWGCNTEEDEEEEELIPTTKKEWDEILNQYDAVTIRLTGLKGLDLEDEDNLDLLLEVMDEANSVISRIDNADTANMTEKQNKRMEEIGNRFVEAAKAIGLIEDVED